MHAGSSAGEHTPIYARIYVHELDQCTKAVADYADQLFLEHVLPAMKQSRGTQHMSDADMRNHFYSEIENELVHERFPKHRAGRFLAQTHDDSPWMNSWGSFFRRS
jgi:hypothetical protein